MTHLILVFLVFTMIIVKPTSNNPFPAREAVIKILVFKMKNYLKIFFVTKKSLKTIVI